MTRNDSPDVRRRGIDPGTAAMRDRAASRGLPVRSIARALHQALPGEQFELFYQPKVDARTLRPTSVEALLRWKHPSYGRLGPDIFVPIAEQAGAIEPIGVWVMRTALAQAARWRDAGLDMPVAFNVSGLQMRQGDFAMHLERSLDHHDLTASTITCEITESTAMLDTDGTRLAFAHLQRLGVRLSVDDFGAGYSSLSSLCRLPLRELKLDRFFAVEVLRGTHARIIVKAVIDMAHALGMRVVAEGVETVAQRDLLLEACCDELQGYHFAQPMTASALFAWARRHDAGTTSALDVAAA
jgi:EAL domain-containing protein (putative c-di-GMP-specific phosphodiesterase class I)